MLATNDKKFKCPLCNYETNIKNNLSHIPVHTREKPFKCPHENCEAAFGESCKLKVHQLIHNKNDDSLLKFKCSSCPYKSRFKSHLTVHLRTHSDVKEFSCDLCPYRSKQKSSITSHRINVHSTEKPFKCPEPGCGHCYKTNRSLRDHLVVHSGDRLFVCSFPQCDFKTNWKNALKNHERVHRGEKPFKCKFCPYAACLKYSLVVHMRIHTGEEPYSCGRCSYRSKTQSGLISHMNRIHRKSDKTIDSTNASIDEKPFKCPEVGCGYSSKYRETLKAHSVVHSSDRPFVCSFPQCDFKTKLNDSLKRHGMAHRGEKPFKCSFCPFACSRRSGLIPHVRRHTGEKPYPCKYCSRRSKTMGDLNCHVKRMHRENLENPTHKNQVRCSIVGCDFSSIDASTLAIHLNGAHSLPQVVVKKLPI